MSIDNQLEARPIYPAGDLAGVIAGDKRRADLLQSAAKVGGPVESFAGGPSPIANITPAPPEVGPVGNQAADYLGLGQAMIV